MKTLFLILVLLASPVMAAVECQTFSDGVTICYPVGGGSTYGK
jgi:hypothetical protein